MNTCKTCKHWDQSDERFNDEVIIHYPCSHTKLDMCMDLDGLHLNNDGFYWLTTGPDFGCIHWEEKK